MKKLNLTQLENVNGRWFWQRPYPEAVYGEYGMFYFHNILGADFCLMESKDGKITEISGSDANALLRCMQRGIAHKCKNKTVEK